MKALLLVLCLFPTLLWGQIEIKTDKNVESLVKDFFLDSGVEVSQVRFRGHPDALAYFESQIDTNFMPLRKGIILSTGKARSLAGLNHSPSTSTNFATEGDTDLDKISRDSTHDAAVLEFDFVPKGNRVHFNYVFTSEEYIEFVGSPYNDVFAFYISEKDSPKMTNIGILPTNKLPITVNNVNHKRNSQFYINNSPVPLTRISPKCFNRAGQLKKKYRTRLLLEEIPFDERPYTQLSKNIQMDGLTVRLTAEIEVVPQKTYHIKIAIADVKDHIFDSGVLLEAGSFRSFEEVPSIAQIPPQEIPVKETPSVVVVENKTPPEAPSSKRNFEKKSIEFDFDSHQITAQSQAVLQEIYQIVKENPQTRLKIYGHTDALGSQEYNLALSQRRVAATLAFLAKMGKINVQKSFAKGEDEPVASNENPEGRQKNRRVEIIFE